MAEEMVVEQQEPNGIVIKDPLGRSITYGEYKKIKVNRANGEKTIYSEGEAIETAIAPDFSDGDMEVSPEDGILFSKITINKPENLIPENIADGTNVGGIIGTHKGGGGIELEGDFLKYVAYQLDNENKEIIIYGIDYTQLYADTGNYDVNIPANFGAYSVVINSVGVG